MISNPIIPGFSPDPSICQYNGIYYLVNSTFQFFPGLPIYASNNLKDWAHISNALSRNNQVDLSKVTTIIQTYSDVKDNEKPFIYNWGICAPTIRHYKDKFYIVCTCVNPIKPGFKEYNNFLITSEDCLNWSDPVYFEFQGIDPDIYFENDKVYITGSYTFQPRIENQPRTSIVQFQIDPQTGKKSDEKEIWKGWSGCRVVPEGPHIYKKKNWYYLLISDGGTFTHHMLTIARSHNVDGPYEEYFGNPILTADPSGEFTKPILNKFGKMEDIQYTGHGDLFQFNDSWWCVLLAVRFNEGKHPVGRETFLVKVDWENDWPVFDKIENNLQGPNVTSKEFKPIDSYLFIKNPILENYKIEKSILIKPSIKLTSEKPGISFLGLRQRKVNEKCFVTLNLPITCKAGLSLFKDLYRVIEIGINNNKIYFSKIVPHDQKIVETTLPNCQKISFKVLANVDSYTFYYKIDDWIKLGEISTLEVTAWDFTGTLFGIFAVGDDSNFVEFENFQTN